MNVYLCFCVCVPLFARVHTQTHTHERLGGSKREKKHSPGPLLAQPQEGQRGDGDIRGEQRQTGMVGC